MIKLTKLTALADLQACAEKAVPRILPVRAVDMVPALQNENQIGKTDNPEHCRTASQYSRAYIHSQWLLAIQPSALLAS